MFRKFCETSLFSLVRAPASWYTVKNRENDMRLKKIEARGFKSFADRADIPFQDGFTAIIGPNGCGKSNVSDSIRWVLGEQSAKQLRGKVMTDVIFNGTETRGKMSYCEVSLLFDNSDKQLFPSLPFDEVLITRKMDRSAESEYYINRTRCLKRDIVNLFHDTGVGKDGYSIIGQGRVNEIMSAKPEERRKIFEEAAGISKAREQRKKSESELEKTRINLNSVNDVIAEIERRIGPLRKQAETALKAAALRDELKKQEVNLYIYNYENAQQIKQRIYDRIAATQKELQDKEKQLVDCINDYEKCLRESGGVDRLAEESNSELLALKVDAERTMGQANLVKERISNLQAEINRLSGELKSAEAQISVSDGLIKKCEERKQAETEAYLEASKEFEAKSKKLGFLSRDIEGRESELASKNDEYVEALKRLGELKGNQSGIIAEKAINEERAKNLQEMLSAKKASLDEAETDLSVYDSNVKKGKEEMRALSQKNNELLSGKLDAQEAVKGLEADVVTLNSKLGLAEGQLRLLVSVKDDYQGYQEAVKQLMRDARHDPALKSRIMGVLAEVITVPEGYESAIEYALGAALQNVLVEEPRDAAALITYLKQKSYGRVTFRPLTSCRPRGLGKEYLPALNEQGCFGIAAELVECEDRFYPFVQTLLGTTVVVDGMTTAERLYKKYNQGFKIVTLDGEIYARGGEITGGSRRTQNSGLLSQEKQIEQAKVNVDRIKSRIASLGAQREERLAEIAAAEEELQGISSRISEVSIETGLNENKARQAAETVEQLQTEIASDAQELEKVKAIIKALADSLTDIDRMEADVKQRQEEYGTLIEASRSQGTEQKSERETLSEEVMALRLRIAEQKNAIDGFDTELFRLRREENALKNEREELAAELEARNAELEKIRTAPSKTVFSEEDKKRIEELEKQIAGLSEMKRKLSERIVALDADRTRLTEEKTALSEKKIRDENMLESVDNQNAYLQQHILEEYDLTYTSALPLKDENFEHHGAKGVIAELKKSIAKLGEVNPLAVQDLADSEARLEEQTAQRDDILQACRDIKQVIDTITEEMRSKFLTAFNQINQNFHETFVKLFGGGSCDLKLDLSETDDPLEAGIEIFSQPPGKRLQNISLLSGGEQAFTAIAILFAILMLKPMPFCVLDEIDSALDDSNANLFAEYLRKFSEETQFIVITHRKATMRHASTIFGVTMEEKGVTKIVSISFDEAVKRADKINREG